MVGSGAGLPGSSQPGAPSAEERRRQISTLLAAGRRREALAACEAAIAEAPEIAGFQLFKALCLLELGRHEDVVRTTDALDAAGQPPSAPAFFIRAQALWRLGREGEAVEAMKTAVSLNPGDRRARELLGRYALTLGDFDLGWQEHEHRLARLPSPRLEIRRWAGKDLRGKRLLVISEQGLGDTLQFARYLPMLRERAAAVTAVVQPATLGVLRSVDAAITWTSDARIPGPFDLRIDLLSLPLMFATRLDTIPHRVPYVFADTGLATSWARALGPGGFRIGLAWQGSIGPMRDDERTIPPRLFCDVAGMPNVRLVSLQGVNGLAALGELPAGMVIERLGDKIEANPNGITEIAAVMQSLDLVITSDTMVAHLAGALGRPVWVGLKRNADWRWLRNRTDSPWYPTMRLFRQERPGDWAPVISAMATAVKETLEEIQARD